MRKQGGPEREKEQDHRHIRGGADGPKGPLKMLIWWGQGSILGSNDS